MHSRLVKSTHFTPVSTVTGNNRHIGLNPNPGIHKGVGAPAVQLTASQSVWRQLRSPFLLPVGTCGECTHWDPVEFGCMGCLQCGNLHICSEQTCDVPEIESFHICVVTGTCVKFVTYDATEYLPTVYIPQNPVKQVRQKCTTTATTCLVGVSNTDHIETAPLRLKRKALTSDLYMETTAHTTPRLAKLYDTVPNKRQATSRCHNFHERICLEVLCSSTTAQCIGKETTKLHNRLRWSFMRHIRATKLEWSNRSPNLIVMISKIAADIENYRIPITNPVDALRRDLAARCAMDIFKFTASTTQLLHYSTPPSQNPNSEPRPLNLNPDPGMCHSNAPFMQTIDPKALVIGILYLLRSGLVHNNITVLPRYRLLSFVLPPENFITAFQVSVSNPARFQPHPFPTPPVSNPVRVQPRPFPTPPVSHKHKPYISDPNPYTPHPI